MSLTEKYKDCEIKYITTSFATNDSIQIKYPENESGERFMKCVPIDNDNTDYQNILQWEKIDGNTIAEAD